MKEYWKEIAPDEWKPFSGKRRKITPEQRDCRNPFHFLKRKSMLSHQRRTPCPCCNVTQKSSIHVFQDIRLYFQNSHLSSPSVPSLLFEPEKNVVNHHSYSTREDLIRGEHDRGKKHQEQGVMTSLAK